MDVCRDGFESFVGETDLSFVVVVMDDDGDNDDVNGRKDGFSAGRIFSLPVTWLGNGEDSENDEDDEEEEDDEEDGEEEEEEDDDDEEDEARCESEWSTAAGGVAKWLDDDLASTEVLSNCWAFTTTVNEDQCVFWLVKGNTKTKTK